MQSRPSLRLAGRFFRRHSRRIVLVVLLVPLILQWVLAYVVVGDARLLPPPLLGAKNILIVTAHPDDECLFFAPSILAALGQTRAQTERVRGGLLVMSIGNNYGIGETRKKELVGSCQSLGIDKSRCVALDDPQLQDNPRVWWDTDRIQSHIRQYVTKWDVDAIISFDDGGVSGHINHRAVSAAVSNYVSTNPTAPDAFLLTTTSLVRKFTVIGDLPLTALPFSWHIVQALLFPSSDPSTHARGKAALAANSWHRYLKTRDAFSNHDSQYSWDRHLYLVLSRYVWFNDLTRVPRPAKSA